MHATTFDQKYAYFNEIWEDYVRDKNKASFCDAINANLYLFTISGKKKFEKTINEFKSKIEQSSYDDETFALAYELYDVLRYDNTSMFEEYEQNYLLLTEKEIEKYKHTASILKIYHRILQTITILGATSLPFILNISDLPKSIPITISIILAITATLANFYKFGNHAVHFHQAAENMQYELNLYESGRKHYTSLAPGAALNLFMDKIDEQRHKRNELSLVLEKTSQQTDTRIDELVRLHAK